MRQVVSTLRRSQPEPRLKIIDQPQHDPYQTLSKFAEPALCSNCGAVYETGRWQWIAAPDDSYLTRCPACKRVHQKQPAGYIKLRGNFAHDHRDEMLSLIHHLETRAKMEHPLKRIMWTDYQEDGIAITTTDVHLAQNIGEALHRAYKGKLDMQFDEAEYLMRVTWSR